MNTSKTSILSIAIMILLVLAGTPGEASIETQSQPLDVTLSTQGIQFQPKVQCRQIMVTISAPNGKVFGKTLSGSGHGFISLSQMNSESIEDGVYTYEAVLMGDGERDEKNMIRTGYFQVRDGQVVTSRETLETTQDLSGTQEHFNEWVYITGKLGVGSDMTDGASIPFETILMRQNNCQIRFDDSSTSSTFAQNDWLLKANDTFSGGADYFAIEDDTNNTTPFTIQAGAPDNTLYLDSQGDVGIGTATPAVNLHIRDTSSPYFRLERSSGALVEMYAGGSYSYFGTRDDYGLHLMTNSYFRMTVGNTGNIGIGVTSPSYLLDMNGGAYCNGTTWVNASSREYKENIASLSAKEALDTLKELKPVTFNYKTQKDEAYVGFIAEDVPELVATKDRKGLSTMDVVAVLTRVVQQQQKKLEEQDKLIRELREEMKKRR